MRKISFIIFPLIAFLVFIGIIFIAIVGFGLTVGVVVNLILLPFKVLYWIFKGICGLV